MSCPCFKTALDWLEWHIEEHIQVSIIFRNINTLISDAKWPAEQPVQGQICILLFQTDIYHHSER